MRIKLLFLFIFLLLCQKAIAHDFSLFFTQNQSPLIQIYGLPALGSAFLLPPGKGNLRLSLDYASNYISEANNQESIILDGESARFTVGANYGIWEGLEVGIEIPILILGGGFLDDIIINYHSMFGFPQGGRDLAPRNRLLFSYIKDGREQLRIDEASFGLGDIKFYGAWQLYGSKEKAVISLRTCLKLPTGNSKYLHGSGSTDFSLWINAQRDLYSTYGQLSFLGVLGVMFLSSRKVLPEQQRHLVYFGSMGIGWFPWRRFSFQVQINGHSSFYQESELRELNALSAQIVFGGTIVLSEQAFLDIGIAEDLIVKTSPDVVFHLSYRYIF